MNFRYRLHYAKTASIRYTSNLDIHKMWERAFRRAQLPLAYSQGFHPQPKIQQASPLPLGFLSQDEILDFYLKDLLDIAEIKAMLKNKLPAGIEVLELEPVIEKEPALQTQVISTIYEINFLDPVEHDELRRNLEGLLGKKEITRIRRNKQYDLRPLIEMAEIKIKEIEPESIALVLQLSSREGATGRPEEVLDELSIPMETTRITRRKTILRSKELIG